MLSLEIWAIVLMAGALAQMKNDSASNARDLNFW